MSALDTTTQQELLELLSPLLERESDRRALLASALGADCPVLQRIEWGGAVEPFILRMSEALARFGEVRGGEQALWALLQSVRERVGIDRQARIDALKPIVNRAVPASPPVRSATEQTSAAPLHIRVFLASPGDVADERALARQVLERLPYDPLLRGQVTIEPVAWDQPGAGVPMLATMTPQAAIEAGLPKPSECDIVVVIFWARMGRPLSLKEDRKPDGSPYLSGTEWEYLDALKAAEQSGVPEILVYRRTEPYPLFPGEPDFDDKLSQWKHVQSFFAAFDDSDGSIRRGYNAYAAPEEFRQQLDLHLRSIIRRLIDKRGAARAARPLRSVAASALALWPGSPFPGLRAFTPDDGPIFFGRGREADELVRRIAAGSTRFVVVAGASGSGKSSLVAAGLIPRLRANAIEGSKDWLLPGVASVEGTGGRQWIGLRFSPGEVGDNPLVALATKLCPLMHDEDASVPTIAAHLAQQRGAAVALIGRALQGHPPWAKALIVMDQFEELFTSAAEEHRDRFVEMLAAAVEAPRLVVVATLRADFFHRCLELPQLAKILRPAAFPLAAPGLGALFEMITGPAARAGVAFEDGLPARILDDTGTESGALPLLAYALHELYEARTADGRLTHSAYDAFDGVRGAISRRAEDTFARLPSDTQDLLASVFRDLVEVDTRGLATRRRVPREQLSSSVAAGQLIDAFIRARLLVTDRGPNGKAIVEVAHEALLREWPRLATWISERARDLRLWQQLETAASDWQYSGFEPSHLWVHERLVLVDATIERLGIERASLSEPVKSFVRPESDRLLEELKRPDTSHYRRAEIGDRLNKIGDRRPGVGVWTDGWPDIAWCEVPGGNVTLEDVEGQFRVERFFIARYPVTFRQFSAFVKHPAGYHSDVWWWGLRKELQPGEQFRQIRNCPAENVSWYDAIAFCRWLSTRLGYEVRLPTEFEWQRAAVGDRMDRQYPWGSDRPEEYANTEDSRLGRTTAVGMYPNGTSELEVLDLAGNVWEWCFNKYDNPEDITLGGVESRALRGGSWRNPREYCRATYRGGGLPSYRNVNVGFRLATLKPAK
jgi:hypothetical protein